MNDNARWETPELERLGHARDVQSGQDDFDTEEFAPASVPSGPIN